MPLETLQKNIAAMNELGDSINRLTNNINELKVGAINSTQALGKIDENVFRSRLEILELINANKELAQNIASQNEAILKMATSISYATKTEVRSKSFLNIVTALFILLVIVVILVLSGRSFKLNPKEGSFEMPTSHASMGFSSNTA
jgi:predicted PurR-regulated permease PerM